MSEFDKIIGYDSIKEELMQLCDMINNFEVYEKLGAKMPKGLLLEGDPGVGKSLMARSFAIESGRKTYTIRRNRPDGDFVKEIKKVFKKASENTPSIIILDDMDKFVVEEKSKEEYVALQAAIDEVSISDVYVVATANDTYDIPDSLLRAGRFDRKISVDSPSGEDAAKIVKHYISTKAVVGSVNVDDIAKMLSGKSCAELETILNEAAILAGFERCENITMKQIVNSALRIEYGVIDESHKIDSMRLKKNAYHEAGHVVMSEFLDPENIGLVSLGICGKHKYGGFVIRNKPFDKAISSVLMALAGKAAFELKYGSVDEGAEGDLSKAKEIILRRITINGLDGISGINAVNYRSPSDSLYTKQEGLVHAELERCLAHTKEILADNLEFLEIVAKALVEKKTLLHSDVLKLKESCKAKDVVA